MCPVIAVMSVGANTTNKLHAVQSNIALMPHDCADLAALIFMSFLRIQSISSGCTARRRVESIIRRTINRACM